MQQQQPQPSEPTTSSSSSSSQPQPLPQRPQHRRVLSQSERLLRATLAKQDARSAAAGAGTLSGGVSDVDEDEECEDGDREMWARHMTKSPHCSPAQFLSVQQWQLQSASAMSSPSPSPRTRTSPLPPPPSPALARTFSGAAIAQQQQQTTPQLSPRPGHRLHQSISALPSSTSLNPPPVPAVSLRRNKSIASNASAGSPIPRSSHEAILRARLESVLAAAESHTDCRKTKQPNPTTQPDPADNHTKISPNDWPWTAEAPVTPTSDSTPPLSSDSHPSSSDSHPPSPTATPPRVASHLKLPNAFDVRTASIECKAKSGYVSFGDIEGLGSPPEDSDDDSDDDAEHPRRTAFGRFLLGGWWKPKSASAGHA